MKHFAILKFLPSSPHFDGYALIDIQNHDILFIAAIVVDVFVYDFGFRIEVRLHHYWYRSAEKYDFWLVSGRCPINECHIKLKMCSRLMFLPFLRLFRISL